MEYDAYFIEVDQSNEGTEVLHRLENNSLGNGENANDKTGNSFMGTQRGICTLQDDSLFLFKLLIDNLKKNQLDTSESFRRLGKQLYDLLFPGEVLKLNFAKAIDLATSRNRGLRLYIKLSERSHAGDIKLASLPWELMATEDLGFLATSPKFSIIRQVETVTQSSQSPSKPPLRVLFVSSQPEGLGVVHAETAQEKTLAHFENASQLDFRSLSQPNWYNLSKAIQSHRPHILHFMGHADLNADGARIFLVSPESEAPLALGSDEVSSLFENWRPDTVVIAACESAAKHLMLPYSSLAQAVAQQGIQVIAMQFKVSNQVALTFTDQLYKSIKEGDYIDTAVQKAREQMLKIGAVRDPGEMRRDFLAPVIYCEKPSRIIFQEKISPYKGLSPFSEQDMEYFFGRDRIIRTYLEHITDISNPLLGIMGASGIGKSSMVNAGLIPKIKNDGHWLIAKFRPHYNPFSSLAAAVYAIPSVRDYQSSSRALHEDLVTIQDATGKKIILFVDQFEEIFTLSNSEIQEEFLACLLHSCNNKRDRREEIKVIFTCRTDFHDTYIARSKHFFKALERNWIVSLPHMQSDGLCSAIVEPAKKMGVQISLEEAKESLANLWRERVNRDQKVISLRKGSGEYKFEEIVTNYADQVLADLGTGKSSIAQRLLKRLISINDPKDASKDTRKYVNIEDICNDATLGTPKEIRSVIDELIDDRLLSSDRGEIALVHEILIQQWKNLQEWVRDERELHDLLRRVDDAWTRKEKELSEDMLIACLDWRNRWGELSQNQRCYIRDSLDGFFAKKLKHLIETSTTSLSWTLDEYKKAPWEEEFESYLSKVLATHTTSSLQSSYLEQLEYRRVLLTLVSLGNKRCLSDLASQLLDVDVEEYEIICGELSNNSDALSQPFMEKFWIMVLEPAESDKAKLLRVAGFLAKFDSENSQWSSIQDIVVRFLIQEEPSAFERWLEIFFPVRMLLRQSLTQSLTQASLPIVQKFHAASALIRWFSEQPFHLVESLLVADVDIYNLLIKHLKVERVILSFLENELTHCSKKGVDSARGTKAAIALMHLNCCDQVWPILQTTTDPTVRNCLINQMAKLQVDQNLLIKRLCSETNSTSPGEQKAIILALGEFPYPEHEVLHRYLKSQHTSSPDSGIHFAIEWLYRVWGHLEILDSIPTSVEPIASDRQWYVNTEGQSFAIVTGPVAVRLGSSPHEDRGRDDDENICDRIIPRSYAIATTPVTVAQYQRFDPSYVPWSGKIRLDAPVTKVTWYQAMEYCLWLSQVESIDPAQFCYQLADSGPGKAIPVPDYLSRSGYRLPSEAEWECACRAETHTSRYFGEARHLLKKYAWYIDNTSDEVPMPVGQLKPNDWGLFDTLGNVWEWCQETFQQERVPSGEDAEDRSIVQTWAQDGIPRVLRGGSCFSESYPVRAACRDSTPPKTGYIYHGFRVARTILPSPERNQ
jgi:formylglycine-generating enzyme required for sulfatase activity